MLRLFKIIAIILVLIFVIIGLITTCTGYVMVKGVESAVQSASQAGPQTVTITPYGAEIVATLKEKSAIILNGVELCSEDAQEDTEYTTWSSCFNGDCQA